jgi:ATP-dependent RNA helicase DDX51/DBP6
LYYQEKTKAKQKYLKRKKGRRKANKKTLVAAAFKKQANDTAEAEEDEDEESVAQPDGEMDVDEELTAEVQEEVRPPEPKKPKKPKKKRQKVDLEEETQPDDDMMVDVGEEPSSFLLKEPDIPPDTLPAAFPSFPLPKIPNAPSKADLALQGLDRALFDAEIVESTTTIPISIDPSRAGSLSERTIKRLNDLGISELFAGAVNFSALPYFSNELDCVVQTALLPFLIPTDPKDRALYRHYDPPRDVCVSAPTGSGKTLAYVIPIVEVNEF